MGQQGLIMPACSCHITEAKKPPRKLAPAVMAAYEKKLKALIKQAEKLDLPAMARARALIKELHTKVLAEIATAPGGSFDAYWLPRFKDALGRMTNEFSARYGEALDYEQRRAWDWADHFFDTAAPAGQALTLKISIDPKMVAIMQGYSADLIKGLSQDIKNGIAHEVTMATLSGGGISDVIKKIGKNVTTKGTRFRSAAYRAELIARTEMARARNLGIEAQFQEYGKITPDMVRIYVDSEDERECEICLALHGTIESWDSTGEDTAANLTTFADTHPNCRCLWAPWFEEFGKYGPAEVLTPGQGSSLDEIPP